MGKPRFLLSVIAGILIFLISIYGFLLLRQRRGLSSVFPLQKIKSFDGISIQHLEDFEFLLSKKKVGEDVVLSIETEAGITQTNTKVILFYSENPLPIWDLVIGALVFGIGLFVYCYRPEDKHAVTFFRLSVVFATSLIVTGQFRTVGIEWLSYIPPLLFCVCYPLSPALLMHFSLGFSEKRYKWTEHLVSSSAAIIALGFIITFLLAMLRSSIGIYRLYLVFMHGFRFYIIFLSMASVAFLFLAKKQAYLEEHQAQIKWILFGLFTGLGPFIVLYQFPLALNVPPILSEELSIAFCIFIPVCVTIAIVRFRLMDIEIVINRSLVYSSLTIFTVGLYLISTNLLHSLFSRYLPIRQNVFFVMGALGAAVVFHPARKKIQDFVDKSFFRISYDYRQALLSFQHKALRTADMEQIADLLHQELQSVLPIDRIGIGVFVQKDKQRDKYLLKNREVLPWLSLDEFLAIRKISARKKAIRTEIDVDFSLENILRANNLEMIVPFVFKSEELSGFMALRKKRSGEKYLREDMEILQAMAAELAVNLERIRLLEEVIKERAEIEKLDEINRLKTEFVSAVSHELRTPMSSLQGLVEVLQDSRIKKSRQSELLGLMSQECSRLSRFLHNILDIGKIEQNTKIYSFQNIDVVGIVQQVARLYRFQMDAAGFAFKFSPPSEEIQLNLDGDAVKQALTNLLDNAIKYSHEQKEVKILIQKKEPVVEIQVMDKGIGIPASEKDKIFEKFYRSEEARQLFPRGVGLGLKIVKHIMDAHKGDIKVESPPKGGSIFTLVFPKP